jgi:hypothetical protein
MDCLKNTVGGGIQNMGFPRGRRLRDQESILFITLQSRNLEVQSSLSYC